MSELIKDADTLKKRLLILPRLLDQIQFLTGESQSFENDISSYYFGTYECACGSVHERIPKLEKIELLGVYEDRGPFAILHTIFTHWMLLSCGNGIVSACRIKANTQGKCITSDWHTCCKTMDSLDHKFLEVIWDHPVVASDRTMHPLEIKRK